MNKNKSLLLVAAITIGIILLLYKDVVFHLNDFLFTAQGDGTKNYFNFLYHIKWDSSYFNFQGMNYPYNEFLLMVDCHPLFANLLKLISENIVDITPYSVGILNSAMLFSLILTSIFVFLILDFYKFPWHIASAGAIAITFLSSNALLWAVGHYALSYSCFFPISWLLILKFNASDKKIKYSLFILANTLFWFYIHNYLGLIILGFTFAYHLFSYLIHKNKIKALNLYSFSLQVIVPLIFVYSAINLFDTHLGRIVMPYITEYRASVYSVFLPNHSFLKPLYNVFFDLSVQDNQKWCNIGNYIGLTTNLTLIGTIVYIIYKFAATKKWIANSLLTKSEWAILLSGIALLLFSMAFPFRFNMHFLLPPIMKQFVAIGRFAWAFYFIIIIISFQLLRQLFSKQSAHWLIFISSILLFSEGLSYHLELNKKLKSNPNIFITNSIDAKLAKINFSDYQAIIPIPFYHKYISLHKHKSTTKSEQLSMSLAYQSGLPLMSAILSRPSVIESKQILQIFAPAFFNKPLKKDMNSKPLLLVNSKDEHSNDENELLNKAELIHENKEFEIYKLPFDSIFYSNNKQFEEFTKNKDAYIMDSTGYYKKYDYSIYYDSYDHLESPVCYRGNGALALKKNKLNIIYKSKANTFAKDTIYTLSFWYYNNIYDQTFNSYWLEITDAKGEVKYSQFLDPVASNIYDGNWAFNEIDFSLPDTISSIAFISKGLDYYSDSIYFDELLIKPKSTKIYKPVYINAISDSAIIENNYTITLKK